MSWQRYKPNRQQPWNLLRVWTLHRRAGFAGTWTELQRDLADGPEKTISRILDGTSRTDGLPDNFAEMRQIIGKSAENSDRPERLMAWWVYQMYFSPDSLRERMTLVWHNHFATSNAKVKNLLSMKEQNEVFRKHGLGDFETLLTNTLKHPAMLKWLDGNENRAGRANENLGRETLELFTLGVGNYSESDVENASRALTGWSIDDNKFVVRDEWHDSSEKSILGRKGHFKGDDLIDITLKHPATPKRLAWRLCNELLAESLATEKHIDELATILSENRLNIRVGLETILTSELFFSTENLKQRIVDPESLIVGSTRALETFEPPASTMVLADWIEQTGRKLFYPPNVGGWPGGRSWLNSRTAIARANFGAALVQGKVNRSNIAINLSALAEKHSDRSTKHAIDFFTQLLTGKSVTEGSQNQLDLESTVIKILASPSAQLA